MTDNFPTSWTDPTYVATVVMILSMAAVIFCAALTPGPPAPRMVMGVILAIVVPVGIAHEIARRWG